MGLKRTGGADGRRERREFSEEFKAEAVRLAAERRATGGTLTQLGRELDVRPDQLRAWSKRHRTATGAGMPGETVEQENRRLRREVAVLRQEQAFGKKVAVYSAELIQRIEQLTQGVAIDHDEPEDGAVAR